jgi:hypothetical protein
MITVSEMKLKDVKYHFSFSVTSNDAVPILVCSEAFLLIFNLGSMKLKNLTKRMTGTYDAPSVVVA